MARSAGESAQLTPGPRLARGRAPALAALALVALAGLARGQAARPDPSPGLEAEVAARLEALAGEDPAARERAWQALYRLGPAARPWVLRALQRELDPDVRFLLLYLVQAEDKDVERLLRQVLEGHPVNSGTYPEALAAREGLLTGPERRLRLWRVVRRYAQAGDSPRNRLYVSAGLDILAEALARGAAAGDVDAEEATRLASLLELDLEEACFDLAGCFAALPTRLAYPALQAVLAQSFPLARARAARLLAEIAPPEDAARVAGWLAPLLRDPLPILRRAALVALDVLPLRSGEAMPVMLVARDPDAEVAASALALCGLQGQVLVREVAERVAGDEAAPHPLRAQALRTIGLLGQPGSGPLLHRLAGGDERELKILAAWALGATRAPGSEGLLGELVRSREYGQQRALQHALARLGTPGALQLLGELMQGQDRSLAVEGLADCLQDVAGAAALLGQFAGRLRRSEHELGVAVRSLTDLICAAGPASEPARRVLAESYLAEDEPEFLGPYHKAFASVGGPADKALAARLAEKLRVSSAQGRFTRLGRSDVTDALARVDPVSARTVISAMLGPARPGNALADSGELRRELARSLARAGSPDRIDDAALPYSRRQVEDGPPDQRNFWQNNVGIDLLYARRFEEAILAFRQMLWCNPRDPIASYNVACGYALQGKVEPALRWLRRAIHCGYDDPRHMQTDTDLDVLHGDVRFDGLARRMLLGAEVGWPRVDYTWPSGD